MGKEYHQTLVTFISFLNAYPANFLNAFSARSRGKEGVYVLIKKIGHVKYYNEAMINFEENRHKKQMLKPQ